MSMYPNINKVEELKMRRKVKNNATRKQNRRKNKMQVAKQDIWQRILYLQWFFKTSYRRNM